MNNVIIQPKRILFRDYLDSSAEEYFHKRSLVEGNQNIFAEAKKPWLAAYGVEYKGTPYIAVPRRTSIEFLEKVTDVEDYIKDLSYWKGSTRDIEVKASPRDEEQTRKLDFLMSRGEYADMHTKRRALFAETGAGKTFLTLKTISERKAFAYVAVPDIRGIDTWKEEIAKFTNIKPSEIAVLQGHEQFEKIAKNKEKYKIVLGSNRTLGNAFLGNNFITVENFFKEMEFDMVVYDEIHLHLMILFYTEMTTCNPYTLYLSATPYRLLHKEHKLLQTLLPQEKYCYIDDPVPRFNLLEVNYWSNLSKEFYRGICKPTGIDYSTYSKKVALNPKGIKDWYLDNVIRKSVRYMLKHRCSPAAKVAIVGRTKEENKIIYDYLCELYKDDPSISIGLYNTSIASQELRTQQLDCKIIVTTSKGFDGVINVENLESMLSLYPVTSEAHILQVMGRIRNKPVKDENGKEFIKNTLFLQAIDNSVARMKRNATKQRKLIRPVLISEDSIALNSSNNDVCED